MAAGKLVGHVACPECKTSGAEVKEDKNGHLYRWCPDCNAQYFTRGDDRRMKNLREQMTPLPAPSSEPAKVDQPPAASSKRATPDPAPSDPAMKGSPQGRKPFSLGDLA